MNIDQLRREYHRQVCAQILSLPNGLPNIADKGNRASIEIAASIVRQIGLPINVATPTGQSAGALFEKLTNEFLSEAFAQLRHIRPGQWQFAVAKSITEFDQYRHLDELQQIILSNANLAALLSDSYLISPDIVVGRYPVSDKEINQAGEVVDPSSPTGRLSPLRESNYSPAHMILHAIISCKWTLRSDRAQNIRAEALNLIRYRRGHTPHAVAVVAEPLPTRIASIALGTGDLDCIYHFALYELEKAVQETHNEDQQDILKTLLVGRRLRDISDLPLDLAI